jgi:N-acetylmuramoyl-L-alanine amidase
MSIKTTLNYSPNFDSKKRAKKDIKFIIFHYTGMKNGKKAIQKLTKIQSEVSSHYFIKKNGEIITLVPDSYTAWHAGISFWKNFENLNKNSIGIEIDNPGHQFGYEEFSKKQINSLIKLSKFLIKKYKINNKNILGHSDIAPFRKKDPGEKFPWEQLSRYKIGFWHKLSQRYLSSIRKKKVNNNDKNITLKNIFKIGYSPFFKKKISNEKKNMLIIKAFQRRFRPKLVNGKIDRECLIITKNLVN